MNKLKDLRDYLKNQWEIRTTKQRWHLVYMIGKIASNAIGITVYDDMKNYWYSYFPAFLGFFHSVMIVYTLWLYFSQGLYKRGMECTCVLGVVITIMTVYFETLSIGRFKLNNITNIPGKYFYADDKGISQYHTICDIYINKLFQSAAVIYISLLCSYGITALSELYSIVFINHSYTILQMDLPFVDSSKTSGYAILIAYQLFVAIVSLIGSIVIEVGVVLVNNAFEMIPVLIGLRSGELNSELNTNGRSLNSLMRFRNICLQIQDFNCYLEEFIEVFYTRNFIGPFLYMYSMSFSIFGQIHLGYTTGYGIALCSYILLLLICNCGEIIKQSKQNIIQELYNMQWYYLPPSQQRQLKCLIHYIQIGAGPTMGPFGPLNFESFADMTKSVFRLTLALFNMFKS